MNMQIKPTPELVEDRSQETGCRGAVSGIPTAARLGVPALNAAGPVDNA